MTDKQRLSLKYVSGIFFGIIFAGIAGRFVLIPLAQRINSIIPMPKPGIGFIVLFIGFSIAFYLGLYLFRFLLYRIGLMTREEVRAHPFCIGIQDKNNEST